MTPKASLHFLTEGTKWTFLDKQVLELGTREGPLLSSYQVSFSYSVVKKGPFLKILKPVQSRMGQFSLSDNLVLSHVGCCTSS